MQAPDEEFEEYLRHLIGEKCTGDRNEVLYVKIQFFSGNNFVNYEVTENRNAFF